VLLRGGIYWAAMPGDKRRPVLVVSPEARNRLAHDVIVLPISSVASEGPWHVRLGRRESGLPKLSVVLCEQITTLLKERIDVERIGGPLPPMRMAAVERAVLRAIGVPMAQLPSSS
jgi:mRNA-degrading endonuclease toxin of MazEF toxin-antitoxin module